MVKRHAHMRTRGDEWNMGSSAGSSFVHHTTFGRKLCEIVAPSCTAWRRHTPRSSPAYKSHSFCAVKDASQLPQASRANWTHPKTEILGCPHYQCWMNSHSKKTCSRSNYTSGVDWAGPPGTCQVGRLVRRPGEPPLQMLEEGVDLRRGQGPLAVKKGL